MHHITRCLNAQLLTICHRAIQLEALNSKLKNYLPKALQEQCQVASFTNGCLVIQTSDSVWASQLRYSLPKLRDALRSEAGIYQLASIKITISTDALINEPKKTIERVLSTTARESITASGESCRYQPLKDALLHLLT